MNKNLTSLEKPETASIKETVYQELRRRIIFCEAQPGSLIDEKQLIGEFQVSRTPIREALNSLAEEGLVTIYPRRAIAVAPITMNDIDNLFEVRSLLEPYIVRQAVGHVDCDRLVELAENMCESDDIATLAQKDSTFHNYLSSGCRNEVMVNMLESVFAQTQRMRVAMGRQCERIPFTRAEHLAIIECIRHRDADGAEQAMRKHLTAAKMTVMGLYHPVEIV